MIIIGYNDQFVSRVAVTYLSKELAFCDYENVAIGIPNGPDIQFWDLDNLKEGTLKEIGEVLNLKHVPPGYKIIPDFGDLSIISFRYLCYVAGRYLGEKSRRLQQHLLRVFQKVLGLRTAGHRPGDVPPKPGDTGLQAGRGDD